MTDTTDSKPKSEAVQAIEALGRMTTGSSRSYAGRPGRNHTPENYSTINTRNGGTFRDEGPETPICGVTSKSPNFDLA